MARAGSKRRVASKTARVRAAVTGAKRTAKKPARRPAAVAGASRTAKRPARKPVAAAAVSSRQSGPVQPPSPGKSRLARSDEQAVRTERSRRAPGASVRGSTSRTANGSAQQAESSLAQPPSPPPLVSGSDRSTARHAAEELSWADFDRSVQGLAREAARRFKPQIIVGIAHGGVFVGGAIASALKAEFFPVRITRRSRDSGSRAYLGIAEAMPRELKGRRVLLVDDVAASGDSLELAVRLAREAGASRVATAALVKRPDGYAPDFFSRTCAQFIVFPWDYQDIAEDSQVDPDTAGA